MYLNVERENEARLEWERNDRNGEKGNNQRKLRTNREKETSRQKRNKTFAEVEEQHDDGNSGIRTREARGIGQAT